MKTSQLQVFAGTVARFARPSCYHWLNLQAVGDAWLFSARARIPIEAQLSAHDNRERARFNRKSGAANCSADHSCESWRPLVKRMLLPSAIVLALSMAASSSVVAHSSHDDDMHGEHVLAEAGEAGSASGVSTVAPRFGTWGIDTAAMDRSVKPGDDFFRYVNGKWAETSKIPDDRSSLGNFVVLRDLSEARVRGLVEGYAQGNPATDGDSAKVAAIYHSFIDVKKVDSLGIKPFKPLLKRIQSAKKREALASLMGDRGNFTESFFPIMVSDDQRDPDTYALYMGQGGLGLGDRELYLRDNFAPQRERYEAYIAQLLKLAGSNKSAAEAKAIMALETRIAEAHWTRAESRNRDKTYNPTTLAELSTTAPGFAWDAYFKAAGVDASGKIVLRQDTAIPKIAAIFAETPVETLQAWQIFQSLDNAAGLLSSEFDTARFEFRDKFMSGQPMQRERWKRAVSMAEAAMGEAIGRDYVKQYFPPDAKAKMDALVANVKVAMGARIDTLDWMSPETKAEAHAKLKGFGLKIGYPEKWRDYSGLKIVAGDVYGNAQRSKQFEWDYRRTRIGKPVDKAEWGMTPQTVNAYYSPVKNEIVFPAAILQPPFFDPEADAAVNYGGIGGVIGHEIIHGFDDQGRKSDGNGLLRDWWTAEDASKFEAQAKILGEQYAAYEFPTVPGVHIIPGATMGENIGDLGGITIALEAYRRSLDGKEDKVIDGFTGEQRFFLAWAQVWRTLYRDDALRQQLVGNSHSPGQIRAFAPLRNIDAWYAAFDVKPGDAAWISPENRVRIW
jgi:putative endopeptidase